jgi:hypothetical protein
MIVWSPLLYPWSVTRSVKAHPHCWRHEVPRRQREVSATAGKLSQETVRPANAKMVGTLLEPFQLPRVSQALSGRHRICARAEFHLIADRRDAFARFTLTPQTISSIFSTIR